MSAICVNSGARRWFPSETRLTQDSDQVFITSKKKRVFVTTAKEDSAHPDAWAFQAKPKSYEILALLCWDHAFCLHDFMVPQILYQAPWLAYKKAHKDQLLNFWVRRSDARFYLDLPNAEPIDITACRGDYKAVR